METLALEAQALQDGDKVMPTTLSIFVPAFGCCEQYRMGHRVPRALVLYGVGWSPVHEGLFGPRAPLP